MASSSSGHNNILHTGADEAFYGNGFKEQKLGSKHNEQNGGSGSGGGGAASSSTSGSAELSNGAAVLASNGANGHVNRNGFDNNESLEEGDDAGPASAREFTTGQRDILRVIGQHLRYLGLNKTTDALIRESGCMLEHPIASSFCSLIMNGEWDQAERALDSLKPIMEDSNADIINMKFLILEQKYLECLEDGLIVEALKCLRDELAPLKYNVDRLHELSSFLMCSDQMNLKTLSKWTGKSALSRQSLMDKLQTFLPPHVMLPPRRLEALLAQSIQHQCDKCPYHNVKDKGSVDSWSFLRDHICSKDDFPTHTLQVLNEHCDEVWMCKFSNKGRKLATGSKDGCLYIWDVDPDTYRVSLNKCYEEHTTGVGYIAWSPDDRYLIACGTEESTELWIWDIENKVLKKRLNNNHDDSLTCAAWLPDSQTFVTGGAKGQFYFCDLEGNIRDTWEGIRVKFLHTLPDGLVLAADSLKRIRSYNFKEISDANLIQEDHQIMSFALNKSATSVLISLANQGLHLWDIKDRVLMHRYQGALQNSYMSYGTFGGVDDNFIASGSEDSRVYIWNKRDEQAIAVLEGHTRNVSCVSWNPVHLGMLASASDDGTVRIWGPSTKKF